MKATPSTSGGQTAGLEFAPFLVVTPLGLSAAEALAAALTALGVHVVERRDLHPWSHAATALYARRGRRDSPTLAGRFEQRWRALFPDDRAECWRLAGTDDDTAMRAHKAALRRRFVSVPLDAHSADAAPFSLHAFHLPDRTDVRAEARRLAPFLER